MKEYSPYCSVDEASELVACCLAKNVPFYVCRYPGEVSCRFGAQTQGVPSMSIDNGFRAVPFDITGDAKPFTIHPDLFPQDIDRLRAMLPRCAEWQELSGVDMVYSTYLDTAQSLIDRMQHGDMAKVVLSRTITRGCDTLNFLPSYFARLCRLYPSAYVFMVSYPGVCGWVGATPEVLLQSHNGGYATMALAGTRAVGVDAPWGEKEVREQQYVTQYISDILRSHNLNDVVVNTHTRQAAQVEHLCTHFDITTPHDTAVRDRLVASLHPTPAVAGTPTQVAMLAIGESEPHSRRYYGGYVGEAFDDGRCGLYVNLRSMEFTPDAVRLYVGGGLTAQSVATDEWNETCAKSQTLLKAFQ